MRMWCGTFSEGDLERQRQTQISLVRFYMGQGTNKTCLFFKNNNTVVTCYAYGIVERLLND